MFEDNAIKRDWTPKGPYEIVREPFEEAGETFIGLAIRQAKWQPSPHGGARTIEMLAAFPEDADRPEVRQKAEYVLACVNAIANVAHPDKLGELLELAWLQSKSHHEACPIFKAPFDISDEDAAREWCNCGASKMKLRLQSIGYEPPEKEEEG